MRAARSDNNQAEIVNALRGLGCTVFSLHRVGQGCPDLLCGFAGYTFLVEVKSDKGKLTEDQLAFRSSWQGSPVHIVRTLEDVGSLVKAVKERAA